MYPSAPPAGQDVPQQLCIWEMPEKIIFCIVCLHCFSNVLIPTQIWLLIMPKCPSEQPEQLFQKLSVTALFKMWSILGK